MIKVETVDFIAAYNTNDFTKKLNDSIKSHSSQDLIVTDIKYQYGDNEDHFTAIIMYGFNK